MKDIAKDLNVSVVTVSKVLRNQGDISQATRKKVLKRAKELNYQPNWVARSLVTRRTYIIGLVVPDLMYSFFAEVAKAVGRTIRPAGYNVLISDSEEDPELEVREIDLLLARQVDGLIIGSTQRPRHTDIFKRIEERKVPYVLIDRPIPGIKANYVGVDGEQMAHAAVDHLVRQGCRQIAHIRGVGMTNAAARLKGYKDAMKRHGLKVPAGYVVEATADENSGYEGMQRLLALDPRPDGVFCFNDPLAAKAMTAVLDAGLSVPDDVAVVGAGNVHYSDLLTVPLTTIDQSTARMGEEAAKLLMELIGAKRARQPKSVLLPPKMVERRSSLRRG